jgi:ElaB/YqjD/DUF883 family membrane-anchored ribosome-binding protein
MGDLDSNQTVVSDMKAYEKATDKEIDDLNKEIQNETQYLSRNPHLSPSASSEMRAAIQGQLLKIREIMKQRDDLSKAQAQKAKQWGQQYAGIAPYNSGSSAPDSGTASSVGTAASPVRAAHHDVLASYNPGVVTNAAKIPVSFSDLRSQRLQQRQGRVHRLCQPSPYPDGVTNPTARQNWMNGLLTAAQRESSYNPAAINLSDSNAAAGDPSRGLMQTIPSTFAAYHEPGTSTNIYNPVANIAAAMNYVMSRYGVLPNGSNLGSVPQFNPNDAPQGY